MSQNNVSNSVGLELMHTTSNENSCDGEFTSVISPALMNELILDCIFGSLNLKDLKKCRFVCTRWNIVAELQLRKVSQITLSPTEKTSSKFSAVFENANCIVPFNAVNFNNLNSSTWEKMGLEATIEEWRNNTTSLKLSSVKIYETQNEQRSPLRDYRMSPHILSNLTSLEINCYESLTKISVSIASLMSVKNITLSFGVTLDLGKMRTKLAPREINLHCARFLKNGKKLDNVLLNDFIDFTHTKKVCISRHDINAGISIDMGSDVTLDYLSLKKIYIENKRDAKWTINKVLRLDDISWTEENQMTFTNLDFNNSLIDIAILPPAIERLRLSFNENSLDLMSSIPVVFNKLKYLSIKTDMGDENFLWFFEGCPNLTDVYNHNDSRSGRSLDGFNIDWISTSVRRLEVCEITINSDSEFFGEDFIYVDTLILSQWKNDDFENIFTVIECKDLVICTANCGGYKTEVVTPFYLDQLRVVVNYVLDNKEGVVIFIGPLKLPSDSPFLEFIDRSTIKIDELSHSTQEFWFRFEKHIGVAIDESEFNRVRYMKNSRVFNHLKVEDLYC